MHKKQLLVFFHLSVAVRTLSAYECAPCDARSCTEEPAQPCAGERVRVRDPCGCCVHCSRLQWEPCGGRDWTLGYCGPGLSCLAVNGTGAVAAPTVGVCKVPPDSHIAGDKNQQCPLQTGCNKTEGRCSCETRQTCTSTFMYPDMEACVRSISTEGWHHKWEHRERQQFVGPPSSDCAFSGCNLTAQGCICESHSCQPHFSYASRSQCEAAAVELRCAGVACPSVPPLDCPSDSALTKSYTPPAGCCPTVLPMCTCDFRTCQRPKCHVGHQQVLLKEATGIPGDCCNLYECQRVSPRCSQNGKEFSEGEVYRMDPCWLCQCRGGISFCSRAECAELDCQNFYIPEGECCPVCIDVELLAAESTEATCWVNNKLRMHEEQWKEDDCTFCECVNGEQHCTAMACMQSCQNPVMIPGECCPFCEEPTYETVSPILCPRLENCSLSGTDCPHGFLQDQNGCLLCQCLHNNSCPDLRNHCALRCPLGYEKDDFGCDMCECIPPTPKCRPLSCSKTCPYGYVRNKHGCEMCRCVKCLPFTCDKHCSNGYQQNKKGCSICLCKESTQAPSTTTPPPAPSYCFTLNGHRYEDGKSWHDGCRDCYCLGGQEMCVLITCPVPGCPHPVVRPDQCCPSCEEESGSGQPEGTNLVICRAPGGEFYVEGETWELDECTRCTCRNGRVLCDTEVCPPTLCQTPVRNKDTCCYVCPDDQLKPLLPVNGSQLEYCISSEGDILLAGDSWKANPCTSCTCSNGTIQCFSQRCPPANCRVPVLRKGQCCPHCLEDMTTTSVPLIVSTTTAKWNNTSATDETSITTTQFPRIVAATGGNLSEDFPNQTEAVMIYQSAAWILAGLLLAIVIFFITALLVNKKKKWAQMSCYSAPKKTVILQKHVNKSSVVYMEPSKEIKFQSVKNESGLHYGLEASSLCRDRLNIPRAKLSQGSDKDLQ